MTDTSTDAVDAVEQSTKRQHFTDVRYVTVRWEPYKPDGARQMKAKGRWQEQVGSGDYFRWANCDRPAFAHDPETIEDLRAKLTAANARADHARDAALVEAADRLKSVYRVSMTRIGGVDVYGSDAGSPASCYHTILALRDKPAPAVTVQEAARVMLAVHDGFMAGEPYEKTEADRLFLAASFGAQAFAVCPQSEARPSAMLRALLLALIEPTDPQLDYLRAKNVVRAIAGGGDE